MKNGFINLMMLCGVIGSIVMQSCKKEQGLNQQLTGIDSSLTAVATAASSYPSYTVSTLVGREPVSHGPLIPYPFHIASAADGLIYVSSPVDTAIFKVNPNGSFTKYLTFDQPYGVKAGANGTIYFISNRRHLDGSADTCNVVKVDKNKKITIIPVKEHLSNVLDLAIGPDSSIYIPDYLNHQILKVTKQGFTSVLAGKKGVRGFADGVGSNAHFTNPTYVKFGEDGNLWVVDGAAYYPGQSIRKVSMSGRVTTVYKLKPQYTNPISINCIAVTKRDKNFKLTPYENVFFFVRTYTSDRKVTLNQLFHLSHDNVLTAITGNLPEDYNYKDGPASQANFNVPTGLSVNPTGIFVADQVNGVIRKIVKQ